MLTEKPVVRDNLSRLQAFYCRKTFSNAEAATPCSSKAAALGQLGKDIH